MTFEFIVKLVFVLINLGIFVFFGVLAYNSTK